MSRRLPCMCNFDSVAIFTLASKGYVPIWALWLSSFQGILNVPLQVVFLLRSLVLVFLHYTNLLACCNFPYLET